MIPGCRRPESESKMKAKTDHKKACWQLQAAQVIKNLKKRGIEGVYCESGPQAVAEVCRRVPAGEPLRQWLEQLYKEYLPQ